MAIFRQIWSHLGLMSWHQNQLKKDQQIALTAKDKPKMSSYS